MLAFALVFAACAVGGLDGPPDETASTVRGRVTSVSDGDTLALSTTSGESVVRLAGVNAPEEGACFHPEADRYLSDALLGKPVTVDVVGIDRFGRVLGYVWDGDSLINFRLVVDGLAIAMTTEDPWVARLLEAEEAAFASRTGLWAEEVCDAVGPVPSIAVDAKASVVDPIGSDGEHLGEEVIVIVNTGPAALDLRGWVLRDESSSHRYHFDSTLEPDQKVSVSSADPAWEPGGSPVWNNIGDMALVLDQYGRVLARWRY